LGYGASLNKYDATDILYLKKKIAGCDICDYMLGMSDDKFHDGSYHK